MGLRVTDERGARISLARANVRYWSKFASDATSGAGHLYRDAESLAAPHQADLYRFQVGQLRETMPAGAGAAQADRLTADTL